MLCDKCSGSVFTCDIGRCSACGQHTSSGAFRLCKECSRKLNLCMRCLNMCGVAPLKEVADKISDTDK